MNETIHIDDLVFEVKRSARRKTVGISVERDSSLVAHVPDGVALHYATKVISGRLVWVYQKLGMQHHRALYDVFRIPEFVDGEGFHFLGKHYRLKLVDVPASEVGVPSVRFQGERLLFRREQAAKGQQRIAEHYTRAAHPFLNDAVRRWKRIVGVAPAQFVRVLDLGFRWASCSVDGTLNFHWRTMQLPPRIIEYIVVHELVHLAVSNHSPQFWTRLEHVLPDFESRRKWLKDKGGEL